ncbi:endonuclease Q family protein [Caldalkalibacillus salinus]|uniref:endonuclease Q family protein n=1 Tax=Caldalkalibacillus salinus TaxID=2803787 RepID=UPI001924FF3F|nr:endonuclease Q family protein [Caldalkalibacillus salinus]
MKTVYADLHIHLGQTETGRPVKITASKNMTLRNVLEHASTQKGMQMVGIIDSHVPEVIAELKQLIRSGQATPCAGGGMQYQGTTLILGTEIEIYDQHCLGPIHVLCYFPTLEEMAAFSHWMTQYQKNITLSSQRSYVEGRILQRKVQELGGLFIPAHIFTPFKSLYGKGVAKSLGEVFEPNQVEAVELGLSSDTSMADSLLELQNYPYLTNSDAHSLPKIGREYQKMSLSEADFQHLRQALLGQGNQRIEANYGLDPKLGKYHVEVSRRVSQLAADQSQLYQGHPRDKPIRPPYIPQVPLEYIPGLGPKTLNTLVDTFGSEMNVIHHSTKAELEQCVPGEVASQIIAAREGRLVFEQGGSGKYGKVKNYEA